MPAEVELLLAQIKGVQWLMASLLYGTGLRLMECLRLRVKDADFAYRQILVRDGKGGRDRVTMLPERVQVQCRAAAVATGGSCVHPPPNALYSDTAAANRAKRVGSSTASALSRVRCASSRLVKSMAPLR